MNLTVLCVDDEPNVLAGIQRNLRKQFLLDTAVGGPAGLELMRSHGPYAVVVADMRMPGMDGLQFLAEAQKLAPETVRLMLTGNAEQKTAVEAVNEGHVFRFLNKPCPTETLAGAIEQGIRQYRLVTAERELLENTLKGSVKVLTEVLAGCDPQAFGMGQRLRDAVRTLADFLKLEHVWELEMGAMLSQIGLVVIPPHVVEKNRAGVRLEGHERDMFQRVPEVGADLIAHIPRLEGVASIVLYQCRRFDGTGLPHNGYAGEKIPVGARMLKVLQDWFQMEREGGDRLAAWQRMCSRPGWYDPALLDAVDRCFAINPRAGVSSPDGNPTAAIAFTDLTVGHVLAASVESADGMVLIGPGTTVTKVMHEKLRNFAESVGLKEPIYVEVKPATTATGPAVAAAA